MGLTEPVHPLPSGPSARLLRRDLLVLALGQVAILVHVP